MCSHASQASADGCSSTLLQQQRVLEEHLFGGVHRDGTPSNPSPSAHLINALSSPLRLGALPPPPPTATPAPLAHLIRSLLDRYCGTLAVETGHLSCAAQREWVQEAVESRAHAPVPAQQRHVLKALVHADTLERFLAQRFPSSKRFGIEGCEAAIPGLLALCAAFAQRGGRRVELAMAHRFVDVLCWEETAAVEQMGLGRTSCRGHSSTE